MKNLKDSLVDKIRDLIEEDLRDRELYVYQVRLNGEEVELDVTAETDSYGDLYTNIHSSEEDICSLCHEDIMIKYLEDNGYEVKGL